MAFELDIQLKDIRKSYTTVTARNKAYTEMLAGLVALGIPEESIILQKIDTEFSKFLNRNVEKLVGHN